MARITNRCIFAIVSDFFTEIEQVKASLARLRHAGHDAILFQVLDEAEMTFPFTDAAPFEGLEGEEAIRIDPRALRAAYLEVARTHNEALEKAATASGSDFQRLSTHDWLGPPLAAFVARRNAIIKRGKS
jgi:hypothetical protein